jgi:hypothetical protein
VPQFEKSFGSTQCLMISALDRALGFRLALRNGSALALHLFLGTGVQIDDTFIKRCRSWSQLEDSAVPSEIIGRGDMLLRSQALVVLEDV